MSSYGPHPVALVAGERVGDWIVRKKLGAGSFGAVYLVQYERDFFALKFSLRRPESGDDLNQTGARMGRELASLLRIRHPNIVRLHGYGRWPHPTHGFSYLLLEYVDGPTLHEWRRTVVPTFRQVLAVFSSLALALEALDREKIRHRDVKGANILVRSKDGQPVLVDFGSSQYPHGARLTEGPLHPATPHYRTPESLRFFRQNYRNPEAHYISRVTDDLYSLGVALYESLLGRAPFSLEQPGELLNIEIEQRVPSAPSSLDARISSAMDRVAMGLLAKRPEDRPQTGQSLHDEFQALLRDGGAVLDERVLVRPVDLITTEPDD